MRADGEILPFLLVRNDAFGTLYTLILGVSWCPLNCPTLEILLAEFYAIRECQMKISDVAHSPLS